jgi:hypothetical protein
MTLAKIFTLSCTAVVVAVAGMYTGFCFKGFQTPLQFLEAAVCWLR